MITVTREAAGLPLASAGSYFHCRTASIAAWRSCIGPLTAFAPVTFPVSSTSAETTTVPSTRAVLAICGYTGRVAEICFASRDGPVEDPAGPNAGGGGAG